MSSKKPKKTIRIPIENFKKDFIILVNGKAYKIREFKPRKKIVRKKTKLSKPELTRAAIGYDYMINSFPFVQDRKKDPPVSVNVNTNPKPPKPPGDPGASTVKATVPPPITPVKGTTGSFTPSKVKATVITPGKITPLHGTTVKSSHQGDSLPQLKGSLTKLSPNYGRPLPSPPRPGKQEEGTPISYTRAMMGNKKMTKMERQNYEDELIREAAKQAQQKAEAEYKKHQEQERFKKATENIELIDAYMRETGNKRPTDAELEKFRPIYERWKKSQAVGSNLKTPEQVQNPPVGPITPEALTSVNLKKTPEKKKDKADVDPDSLQGVLMTAFEKMRPTISGGNEGDDIEWGQGRSSKGDGLTDHEIEFVMRSWRKMGLFTGVYSSNEFQTLSLPMGRFGAIINLDKLGQNKLEHWIAFYCDPVNEMEYNYYDSFGEPPTKTILEHLRELDRRLAKMHTDLPYLMMKVNRVVDQRANSDSCGYFAMSFLINRFRGMKFKDVTGYSEITKAEKGLKKFRLMVDEELDRMEDLDEEKN